MNIRLILLLGAMLPLSAGAGQSSLMLGLGGGYGAEYAGSDDNATTALPVFNWEWQRDRCVGGFGMQRAGIGVEGASVAFWCSGNAAVTFTAGYDPGRDSGDSADLSGLPDVDGGLSAGLGFEYGGEESFGFSLEAATVDSDLVATAEVSYPLFGFLEAGLGLNYADKGRMQKYFGVIGNDMNMAGDAMGECPVARLDSTTGGYNDYCSEIGGGIESWTASLETFIPLPFGDGETWGVRLGASLLTLTGDAKDSPLVKDKSNTEFFAAVAWFRER